MTSPITVRETPREPAQAFPPTRWSVVLAAQGEAPAAADALEAICRAYWSPLYAFARRSGHSPHDAQDLTQACFCRLLEHRWLDAADREKGRLRTFLIVAFKRFMANEWRRESAQRRGGGHTHVPIDTAFAESRYAAEPAATPAEGLFDRHWALTLLDHAVDRLRAEFQETGKPGEFDALKACLTAARGEIEYAALAGRLANRRGRRARRRTMAPSRSARD
jgi:DNA-directed RNA polymerase specialized sigma24 family protein